MYTLSKDNKIYIECPASFATGGTEALHVLGYELRNTGIKAYMFYVDKRPNTDPVAERFRKYNVPTADRVDDVSANVMVFPEVRSVSLASYRNIRKILWWLSVDNYYESKALKFPPVTLPDKWAIWKRQKEINAVFRDPNILHLAQSHYALDYLNKRGIPYAEYLADYLGDEFINRGVVYSSANRANLVLYNPLKGHDFTQKIIRKAPDIPFVPLQDMTPLQLSDLFLKSKCYIDFGSHPGKDRFPRESAILGNCVITGRRGSAAFHQDVPVPDAYKFSDNERSLPGIIAAIKGCFDHYDDKIEDFEEYRSIIRADRQQFISDLKRVFQKTDQP